MKRIATFQKYLKIFLFYRFVTDIFSSLEVVRRYTLYSVTYLLTNNTVEYTGEAGGERGKYQRHEKAPDNG